MRSKCHRRISNDLQGRQINSCNTRDRSGTQKKPRERFLQPDHLSRGFSLSLLLVTGSGEPWVFQLPTKVPRASEQLRQELRHRLITGLEDRAILCINHDDLS